MVNDTTFTPPVNTSWPTSFLARGCYDASLSQFLQCPLQPTRHTGIQAAFANSEYSILQDNATARSLVFYLCCNTTLCNNISASGADDSLSNDEIIHEDVSNEADFLFGDEGPVVNPPRGSLTMMDLIMLGVVGIAGFSVGLIVDLAATNRGPFKES